MSTHRRTVLNLEPFRGRGGQAATCSDIPIVGDNARSTNLVKVLHHSEF